MFLFGNNSEKKYKIIVASHWPVITDKVLPYAKHFCFYSFPFMFDTYIKLFFSEVSFYTTLVRYKRRYITKEQKINLTIVVGAPDDYSLTLYNLIFFITMH